MASANSDASGQRISRRRLVLAESPCVEGRDHAARKDPCEVLLVRKDGSTTAYQSYR